MAHQKKGMKGEGEMLVVACTPMAGVSPVSSTPRAQQQFSTPSPFSFSVASTGLSSRPSLHLSCLLLRFLTLIFSFGAALSLTAPSSKKNGQRHSGFIGYSELTYCFIVSILLFIYSAIQLFKGVCDMAHRGILISDLISDYLSFMLDQLSGYLLISSCSVEILGIQQIRKDEALWEATIISISMCFASFLAIAVCTLLSGYKLCKRMGW